MKDLATRIIAIATRLLPAGREEWRAALTAELMQIREPAARVQFSLGCIQASLLAPRTAGTSAGIATATVVLAGVAGCIVMALYTVTKYPFATQELTLVRSLWFAAILVLYCWIALRPPYWLVPSPRIVRVGTLVGVALYAGVTLGDQIIAATFTRELGESPGDVFFMLSVFGTFTLSSAIVAARARSLRHGLAVALWAAIVCALLGFSLDLLATLNGWNLTAHMREFAGSVPDLDHFLRKHLAEHLSTSMRNVGAFALLGLLLGAIGTALGFAARALVRRTGVLVRQRRPIPPSEPL
jgi:hypothetical protein